MDKNNQRFQKLYDKERDIIDKRILKLFKEKNSLYKPAAYIMESGGKRLRPLLVLLSCKAVGKDLKKCYNAAIAVELLHNFTLVHDDIMDNADKRRGRPTLHKKYDESTAILAGDVLLAVAYATLLKDCEKKTKELVASFTKGVIEVCEGQSMDKDFELQKDVSIGDYIIMIEKKTAAMTEMCCSIGAQIGGGNDKERDALRKYGKYLGIAFQIQDDLLDITGDEMEFGKFVGGDLVEGKKTFLFLKAMEKAEGENKTKLLDVIKNKGIKPDKVNQYKKLYEDLGVIEDARKEIIRYTNKALKQLKILKNKEDEAMLTWLAYSLIKRNK
jgi:geranylgeranyl diphosphate synthase, type II